MPDALELLTTRRSSKPVELAGPAPSAAEIETLLTVASRVPDHGKLVPWRTATTHVLTHSLHYGLAVFEGVRAYKTVSGTQIYRLREHTQRLINSAHIYMMKIPYTREVLVEAQKEVVRATQSAIAARLPSP